MQNFQQKSEVKGWIRLNRSDDVLVLMRANPLAYTLATVIALRARWQDGFNQHGLEHGEALLGDYENYGMSEQNYRTAKANLKKWGFATFKSTSAGTVGKLIDTRLFDIRKATPNERTNERPTDAQRAGNERPTDAQRAGNERPTDAQRLTNQYNHLNKEKKETNQTGDCPASGVPLATPATDGEGVAFEKRTQKFIPPTIGEIRAELRLNCAQGESFAEQYFRIMNDQQHWHDENNQPIKFWKKHVVAYAKKAFQNQSEFPGDRKSTRLRGQSDSVAAKRASLAAARAASDHHGEIRENLKIKVL